MSSRAVPLSLKNTITSSPTTCTNHTLQCLLNWHSVIVVTSNSMLEHITLFLPRKCPMCIHATTKISALSQCNPSSCFMLQPRKQSSVQSGAPVPDSWFVFSRKIKQPGELIAPKNNSLLYLRLYLWWKLYALPHMPCSLVYQQMPL